jgi:hypothetical protein
MPTVSKEYYNALLRKMIMVAIAAYVRNEVPDLVKLGEEIREIEIDHPEYRVSND